MSILAWGKPLIEFTVSTAGAIPVAAVWAPMPPSKLDTSKLTTTKGTKLEATEEGGALIDSKSQANKYSFVTEVFVKKGDERPIPDEDGVIDSNYGWRLTPEDDTLEGYIMENASVSVEENWTSKDGSSLIYTFDGLKPAAGKILKPYTKA
jgi:hypothetical protein